jgi:hypothetical protein
VSSLAKRVHRKLFEVPEPEPNPTHCPLCKRELVRYKKFAQHKAAEGRKCFEEWTVKNQEKRGGAS